MRTLPLALATLLAVALVYSVGLRNGFVWLDHFEIVEGALIVDSPGEALALLGGDHNFEGYHRPVYNLLHSLDRALYGLDPLGFQLSSRLWHLVNVALVIALARRLGWSAARACLLALFFGLHPLNTAAAGLIHSKADLFVFTAMAACVALFLGRGSGLAGPLGRGLSLAVFVLALFTKETAFCLPLGAAAWWLAHRRSLSPAAPERRAWRGWLAGLALLTLAVGLLRLAATTLRYEAPLALGERLATFALVYVDDVRRLLVPIDLAVADTVTRFGALPLAARLQGLGALALLVAGQVWLWRRAPFARKWIVLFHLALLPVAQVVPILHFRADRFLYLPSLAALGLAVEAGALALAARARWRPAAAALVALLALAYAARDVLRLRQFESDETLFTAELRRRPDYLEGLTHLARHLDRTGRPHLATELYAACFEPHPDIVSYFDGERTLLAWSANLLAVGRPAEALAVLERYGPAVASAVVREELDYNRGVALKLLGRGAEAFELLSAYGARHPADAGCAFLEGQLALELGRAPAARAAIARYLSLVPDAPERPALERALAALPPD